MDHFINPVSMNYIKEKIKYSMNSIVGKFILTFLMLHTIHYLSTFVYTSWCSDFTIIGYFKNIINGHGPLCHTLMTIAYHAQCNIYTLIGASAIGTGISSISESIFKNKVNNIINTDINDNTNNIINNHRNLSTPIRVR